MKKLKLYDYFRSSASYRVRIALNLKNLSYDVIPIHLVKDGGEQFSETYRQINPHCLVPTLQEQNKFITQSLAIIEYLDEIYPTPALLPTEPYLKALVRSFALAIIADIHPLNNLRVLTFLKNEFQFSEAQKIKWYKHWVEIGLMALEQTLTLNATTEEFCFGNSPTLADICLVPQLYNARRFECDLTKMPTLIKIDKHCQQLNAFSQAIPVENIT